MSLFQPIEARFLKILHQWILNQSDISDWWFQINSLGISVWRLPGLEYINHSPWKLLFVGEFKENEFWNIEQINKNGDTIKKWINGKKQWWNKFVLEIEQVDIDRKQKTTTRTREGIYVGVHLGVYQPCLDLKWTLVAMSERTGMSVSQVTDEVLYTGLVDMQELPELDEWGRG